MKTQTSSSRIPSPLYCFTFASALLGFSFAMTGCTKPQSSRSASTFAPNSSIAVGSAVVGSAGAAKPGIEQPKETPRAEKPPMAAPGCFHIDYKLKNPKQVAPAESCDSSKNLIQLDHAKINSESLCVRVDGVPAHFQAVKGKSGSFVVHSNHCDLKKITAEYCLPGRGNCKKDCTPPRDEFMEAIGALSQDESPHALWDASERGVKLDGDITREVASLDEKSKITSLISDAAQWVVEFKEAKIAACGKI